MSYIYVITNDINGKQYVGKTNDSIEKRFNEHKTDAFKKRAEKRPLYNAINRYGIEHFSIEVLEECSYQESSAKEIYWIGKLDTYKNGYNATLGGDGKAFYDYKELANKYLELGTIKDVSAFYNCDSDTVRKACKEYNIDVISGQEIIKRTKSKKVIMLNPKTEEELMIFNSLKDAGRYLGNETKAKHIGKVCNGQRQTAYGYKWKYVS